MLKAPYYHNTRKPSPCKYHKRKDLGTPACLFSHVQVCIYTLTHIYNYAAVCCTGTTSAARSFLPSYTSAPHNTFPLATNLCNCSTYCTLSSYFPTPCFLFFYLSSLLLPFPPVPSSPLSQSLPPEAGDVEGRSAVSDYQAWLCERNDNHCAALQREKEEREEKREGKGHEVLEKGGKCGSRRGGLWWGQQNGTKRKRGWSRQRMMQGKRVANRNGKLLW